LVDPVARGMGGHALLAAAIEHARAEQAHGLSLQTAIDNYSAQPVPAPAARAGVLGLQLRAARLSCEATTCRPCCCVFDAAGRHLSFKRAAALHVTPSTISQIADLEPSWRRRLKRLQRLATDRRARRCEVAAAFERLRAATARLRSGGQPSVVRISANPFFAAEMIVPQIAAFDARFPGVAIHVSATEALEDPRDGAVDFCVRLGATDIPGLERWPLYPVTIAPVTAARAPEASPARIDFPFHSSSAWQQWSSRVGVALDASASTRQFNSYAAAMRATARPGSRPACSRWCSPGCAVGNCSACPASPNRPWAPWSAGAPVTPSETTLRGVRDWLVQTLREAAVE
jgi:LysR family glycine cleavage system transcriptional activator